MPLNSVDISNKSLSLVKLICFASLTCLSIALLAYAYLGLFNCYLIDDYCVAATLRDEGIFGSQKFWYMTWSGRYTYNLFSTLAAVTGTQTVRVLPMTVLVIWLAVSVWTIKQFCWSGFLTHTMLHIFLFSELIIYVTLQSTPTLLQSFYWQAGMLTYTAPLIILTAYAGFIRYAAKRAPRKIIWLLASAAFTFVAGGLSETNLALQIGALSIIIVICLKSPESSIRRAALPLIIAGLAGSMLAAAVGLLAPGNAYRLSLYPRLSLFPVIKFSLSETLNFIAASTRTKAPLSLLVALLLPALIVFSLPVQESGKRFSTRRLTPFLALLPIAAFTLIFFCFIPSIYATSYPPLPRVLIIPYFILVCLSVSMGYVLGLLFRRISPSNVNYKRVISVLLVAAILTLGPLMAARRTLNTATMLKTQSSKWDKTDKSIRDAKLQGKNEHMIQKLAWYAESVGSFENFEMVEADANYKLNQCVERYYDLKLKIEK